MWSSLTFSASVHRADHALSNVPYWGPEERVIYQCKCLSKSSFIRIMERYICLYFASAQCCLRGDSYLFLWAVASAFPILWAAVHMTFQCVPAHEYNSSDHYRVCYHHLPVSLFACSYQPERATEKQTEKTERVEKEIDGLKTSK